MPSPQIMNVSTTILLEYPLDIEYLVIPFVGLSNKFWSGRIENDLDLNSFMEALAAYIPEYFVSWFLLCNNGDFKSVTVTSRQGRVDVLF